MGEPARPVVVGRYAIYGKIASGGMATVHFGRLLGGAGFSRTVAIKRLHPHLAEDAEFRATMIDEARMAARIHHPNVVATLDVVTVDGELLLVMEYVRGESVSSLVKAHITQQKRIPLPIVSAIAIGALHGLHAAHEATNDQGRPLDIVHRDVSPQNILVGVDGLARVIDFGVAKATGRLQTTSEGSIKGKIAYMPPEQLARKALTRAADIYAMGVVLWEMLACRRLFGGDGEMAIIQSVLAGPEGPPSLHAPEVPPRARRPRAQGALVTLGGPLRDGVRDGRAPEEHRAARVRHRGRRVVRRNGPRSARGARSDPGRHRELVGDSIGACRRRCGSRCSDGEGARRPAWSGGLRREGRGR
jgi:serine/threonine-protein kinase